MDILTFAVGDMRVALPFDRLAISASIPDARVSLDPSGSGTLSAAFEVVDLRKKFEFPSIKGEPYVRLIMAQIANRLVGLVINASSPVTLHRDAQVDTESTPRHPHILGLIFDQGEPAFLFDWDALLTSDTTINLNDLFCVPVLEDTRPAPARFLDAVREQASPDASRIRQMAETFHLPPSVANRLASFYASHSGSPP